MRSYLLKKLVDKLPSRVRVTPNISYEVLFVDNFKTPDILGECRPDTKQIIIKTGLSPKEAILVFLHETAHAFNFEYPEMKLTENQTLALEKALYNCLSLNKIFNRFL